MHLTKRNTSTVPDEPNIFGEFWCEENRKWAIDREHFHRVSDALGFRLYNGELYRIIGRFLFPKTQREFQDTLKEYIQDTGQINYTKILSAYEGFIQKNGAYAISRLPIIQREHILNDTSDCCYKFFLNGYMKIQSTGAEWFEKYKGCPNDKLILASKQSQRDFKYCAEGKYLDFLRKATNYDQYEGNIKSVIGYLCHEFKDETTGYIIVLTEQCPDPKDGGGSGKNLFCNLLSNSTSYHSKNGNQVKFDEKFFQSWNGQRLMGISDVQKNFHFDFLKEPSTGTFILKKLYKDEVEIPVMDGPKFIVQTNYSYEVSDGGLRRRIIPIEFTNFFTLAGGVDVFYGCHFPKGWTKNDWNNFDTVIIESIGEWLLSNRKLKPVELTKEGKTKQLDTSYGNNLMTFIKDNFESWITSTDHIKSKDVQNSLKLFYESNNVAIQFRSTPQRVAQAIKEYSKMEGYVCVPNTPINILNTTTKCYTFTKIITDTLPTHYRESYPPTT